MHHFMDYAGPNWQRLVICAYVIVLSRCIILERELSLANWIYLLLQVKYTISASDYISHLLNQHTSVSIELEALPDEVQFCKVRKFR